MGKKKITKQTDEEVLKETAELEKTQLKSARSSVSKTKRIERGCAYIRSSYNNIVITLTDQEGNVLAWSSSGSLGFKGPKKSTPFAASKVAEAAVEKVSRIGLRQIDIFIKGIGSGRESAIRALVARGFEVLSIKDITPIPHNGCRPRKPRRV